MFPRAGVPIGEGELQGDRRSRGSRKGKAAMLTPSIGVACLTVASTAACLSCGGTRRSHPDRPDGSQRSGCSCKRVRLRRRDHGSHLEAEVRP
jgi:hypothetical protein